MNGTNAINAASTPDSVLSWAKAAPTMSAQQLVATAPPEVLAAIAEAVDRGDLPVSAINNMNGLIDTLANAGKMIAGAGMTAIGIPGGIGLATSGASGLFGGGSKPREEGGGGFWSKLFGGGKTGTESRGGTPLQAPTAQTTTTTTTTAADKDKNSWMLPAAILAAVFLMSK